MLYELSWVDGAEAPRVKLGSIGVRIAIRVPGPEGGEPQLVIFRLENTESSSLVGTAKPDGGDDPDPPWNVLGERLQNK